mmetsp:Transcript_12847/g.22924  ORF Transcript_12847/g.22924 Transcript_12847/m.22924 type:complete len:102 (-) Transcript_12847:905-1210(-)
MSIFLAHAKPNRIKFPTARCHSHLAFGGGSAACKHDTHLEDGFSGGGVTGLLGVTVVELFLFSASLEIFCHGLGVLSFWGAEEEEEPEPLPLPGRAPRSTV